MPLPKAGLFFFMFLGILPSREEGSMKTSTNKLGRKIQAIHWNNKVKTQECKKKYDSFKNS